MDFRVYYADGTTYDGDAMGAPALDALLIVEKDADHGRRIVSGGDYFVWEGGRWWAVDQVGMYTYLVRTGPRRVLIGRMVSNEHYAETWRRAESDTDFPLRTAFGVYEL